MALLQIAEPGQFQAPHQHRLAVGIDLGTTNSLVAAVRSGKALTLPDASGRHLLPSVVRYLPEPGRVKDTVPSRFELLARGLTATPRHSAKALRARDQLHRRCPTASRPRYRGVQRWRASWPARRDSARR